MAGLGTGAALLGGGLLLGIWDGAPFAAAAAFYLASIVVFGAALRRRGIPSQEPAERGGVREEAFKLWSLVRGRPALRSFFAANALWELSLAALKTFVVLYATEGMGLSRTAAALLIGGVAVIVLLAALGAGKLADRYGRYRVLAVALPVYGVAFFVPFAFSSPPAVAISIPFIAVGGGALMALPYALLMPLMPRQEHGALTVTTPSAAELAPGWGRCWAASPSPGCPASSRRRRAIRPYGASAGSPCS